MATASDIINYGKRRTYNPDTGQFEAGLETQSPSPSEVVQETTPAALVGAPMNFASENPVVPEYAPALIQGVRAGLPGDEYSGRGTETLGNAPGRVTDESSRKYTDLANLWQQMEGQPPPQVPSGYTPEPVPEEKVTVKRALIEALKGYIPGYRQLKRMGHEDEIANIQARNAAMKLQVEEEGKNRRDLLDNQRMRASAIVGYAAKDETNQMMFDQMMWGQSKAVELMNYNYERIKTNVQADWIKSRVLNQAFETQEVPRLKRAGWSDDRIESQRMMLFGDTQYRMMMSKDPQVQGEAIERFLKDRGVDISSQGWRNHFKVAERSASQQAAGSRLTLTQADSILDGMVAGIISPILTRFYRDAPIITARAAERGIDLNGMQLERTAAERAVNSINSPQFMRSRAATDYVRLMIPPVEHWIDAWERAGGLSRFKILNAVALKGSKEIGGDLGVAASNLEGAIADLQGEIAIVLQGGYAPTAIANKLAEANIRPDWNKEMLASNLKRIDALMDQRNWSMEGITPITPGGTNRYFRAGGGATQRTPQKQATPKGATVVGTGAQGDPIILMKAPDGSLKKVLTSRVEEAKTKYKYVMPTPEDIRGANAAKAK
jgi:hypothetical protein